MQNASILVVEDEVIIAYDLQNKLRILGYDTPEICTSGEEAIDYVRQAPPDLILMDIQLRGEMTGIDTAEQIQKQYDIPVIYLTAHTDPSTLEKAKHTRPYGYLVKPMDDERSLLAPIEIALYKHQMESILKERESWFSSTLDSIEDAVITTDQNGRITTMNPKARMMTQSVSSSVDGDIDQILPLSDNGKSIALSQWIDQSKNTRRTIVLPGNIALHGPENRAYYIEGSISPIFSPKKQISGTVISFRDITERKKTEDRLRMTQFSLDHVGEGAFWIKADASIVDANETACKMLGFTHDKLIKMKFIEINPGLSMSDWIDYWKNLKNNLHYILTTDVHSRNGRVFPVEVIGNYLQYQGMEFVFIVIHDISERQKNLYALKESQRKLSLFARNFRGIAYQIRMRGSDDFIISYMEGDLERITGHRAELFYSGNLHWNDLIHPEDKQKVLAEDKKIVTKPGYTADTEYRIIKKDGTICWVRDIARIIENEKFPLFQGSIFDITERVHAEMALRESEEKYRSLVELATDGIVIIHDGIIRFANNKIFAMFDLPTTKVLNTQWIDHVAPEDRPSILDYYDKRLKGKEISNNFEVRVCKRGNRFLPVEISAGRIPYHEHEALLVFIRDITERKKAEIAMQQAQRTYHLASLGTLAAGISHEINQPLTALKVKVDGLLYWGEENPEILQKNLKHNLQFVSEQADEINKIIRHMRSLIYQEKSPTAPMEVNPIVQKACRFTEQRLSSHHIQLQLKLSPKNPVVLAIETPLEQVILNLITNATNALDRRDIPEKRIEIQTRTYNDACVIVVKDNGPGIPEEHINRIFDPLFTTEQNGKGMGLGLAIVEELLRQFKATIHAKNQKTGGAQMTVKIPLYKA